MPVPRTALDRSLGQTGGLYDYLDSLLTQFMRGDIIYVDSATGVDDVNHGTRWDIPLATLDYAIGRCTANHGDVIMLAPNHAETVTGVGGITADVAGITIIGLGTHNQRPRFLMDGGTTVSFVVSAADVRIENCVFAAGTDTTATCFDITATGFHAKGLEIEDNTTAEHFLVTFRCAGADNTADGLTIDSCKFVSLDSGITDFISFTGHANRVTVINNFYCVDAATGAGLILCATGKALTGFRCENNRMICGNTTTDVLIDNDGTANTGVVCDNYVGHHDTGAAIIIDVDGVRLFNNYTAEADTTSGAVKPAADAIT